MTERLMPKGQDSVQAVSHTPQHWTEVTSANKLFCYENQQLFLVPFSTGLKVFNWQQYFNQFGYFYCKNQTFH